MSASPRRQQIDAETRDCRALPADCLAAIISLTSPLDACRWSVVSPFFNAIVSSDAVWVNFLPSDYQNLVPASRSTSSLKDLYLSLCDHPVLIEDGKKAFSLHKRSGKKCYMLAARDLAIIWGDNPHYWSWNSIKIPELLSVCWFEIVGRISTWKLSSMTHYKAYLVFKLAAGFYGFTNEHVEATVRLSGTEGLQRTVFLHAEDEDIQNDYQYPVERGDLARASWKSGVIIEGIEIRPN
ncbi:hypothetical protein SLE2022_057630 [Rubroshorea leprosula]